MGKRTIAEFPERYRIRLVEGKVQAIYEDANLNSGQRSPCLEINNKSEIEINTFWKDGRILNMGRAKNAIFRDASEQAYHNIKEMISDYRLIPGQKITYIQLAEKFKMSNTPIINALNRLEQEEFVISIPNRGYFIKEVNIKELNELFMIRESLEVLAIEASINNQIPEKLREIEKIMIAHREHNPNAVTRKRLALDAKFHLKFAEMTLNNNLVRIINNIFERINLRYRSEGFPVERLEQAAKEHVEIYNAFKRKEMSNAIGLMKQHVKGAKEATIKGLRKDEEIFNV